MFCLGLFSPYFIHSANRNILHGVRIQVPKNQALTGFGPDLGREPDQIKKKTSDGYFSIGGLRDWRLFV